MVCTALSLRKAGSCLPIIIDVIGEFHNLLAIPTKQLTLNLGCLPIARSRKKRKEKAENLYFFGFIYETGSGTRPWAAGGKGADGSESLAPPQFGGIQNQEVWAVGQNSWDGTRDQLADGILGVRLSVPAVLFQTHDIG